MDMTSFDKIIEAGARLIQEKGDELEQARLSFILHRQPAPPDLVARFQAAQNEDGGWQSARSPGFSSLDASCFHLSQAWQLGLEGSALWQKTLHFLCAQQMEGGCWEERLPPGVKPSPWLMPGDEKGRIYLTANCGLWLSFLDSVQLQARQAARFLAARQQEDGSLHSFLHAHWLACSLWQRLGMAQKAAHTLDYLQSRLAQFSAGEMAWMLNTIQMCNLHPAHLIFQRGIPLLISMQQPDGCWRSEDGEEFDVHTTLDALAALSAAARA